MVTLTPLRKEEKKKEKKEKETKLIFGSSCLAHFSWKLECGLLTVEDISTAKIIRFHTSSTKLCMRENYIIVLPVNIFMGVVRRLLGPLDTLTCVLITSSLENRVPMYKSLLVQVGCIYLYNAIWAKVLFIICINNNFINAILVYPPLTSTTDPFFSKPISNLKLSKILFNSMSVVLSIHMCLGEKDIPR